MGRTSSAVAARVGAGARWLQRTRTQSTPLDIAMRLYERDREAAGTIAGSAVAFRLFLFCVPTMLVVVALAGFLQGHVSAEDATSAAAVTGALASQIEQAFSQSSTARWAALVAGLFGMATSGRSLTKALVLSSALSWQVPPRRHKATVQVTVTVVGIIVVLAIVAAVVNRLRASFGVVVAGASLVGIGVVYVVAWLALCFVLPRSTRDPGALLPGAGLIGLSMVSLQAITQLYVPQRIDQASSLYGALGVTIVTLSWFFVIGRLAVLSMTINAVVYEQLGSVSTFVFGLPVVRRLPVHFPVLVRFFGLSRPAEGPPTGGSVAR